jgi:hypothetical protein
MTAKIAKSRGKNTTEENSVKVHARKIIFWILHAHFTVDYLRIIMLHLMILTIFLPIRNFQCTYFI